MAAILRGDQGSFSVSTGTLNVTLTNLIIDFWEMEEERGPITKIRQFGSILPTRIQGGKDAVGRFRAYAPDGTTPPQIGADSGTTGTLRLGIKSTTQTYIFKALVTKLRIGANASEASPVTAWYEFGACEDLGTLNSDIAVA